MAAVDTELPGMETADRFGPCEECDKGPWKARNHYVSHWAQAHPDLDPPEDATPETKPDRKPSGRGAGRKGKPSVAPLVTEPLAMLGAVWATRDPVCGPILVASAERIGEAVNMIAQGNPALYRRLTEGAGNMGYMALAFSLFDLLNAIREHHVTPKLEAIAARREAQMAEGADPAELQEEAEREADREREWNERQYGVAVDQDGA